MKTVNLYEAKTQLSALVQEAANGEEIIIAKNGKPMARLVKLEAPAKRVVNFGAWSDWKVDWEKFHEADKEIEAMFYGEEDDAVDAGHANHDLVAERTPKARKARAGRTEGSAERNVAEPRRRFRTRDKD